MALAGITTPLSIRPGNAADGGPPLRHAPCPAHDEEKETRSSVAATQRKGRTSFCLYSPARHGKVRPSSAADGGPPLGHPPTPADTREGGGGGALLLLVACALVQRSTVIQRQHDSCSSSTWCTMAPRHQ